MSNLPPQQKTIVNQGGQLPSSFNTYSNQLGQASSQLANTLNNTTSITIPKGATLSGIAKQYGTTVDQLMAANPQIKNPDLIYAGANLTIPTATTQSTKQPVKQSQSSVQQSSQQPPPPQQPPPQQPNYAQAYQNILNQYSQLLNKYSQPPDTSAINQSYSQATQDLKARYQKMLDDLQKKQLEEQQRLLGRYAAAGFSEPGIIGGPAAGIPGIATKGLNELKSQQQSDITNLLQAESADVNALELAKQSAMQQAIDNYNKQLQLLQSALMGQANLVSGLQPQDVQIGSRIYRRDPVSGQLQNITPPEVEQQIQKEERQKGLSQPFIDSEGNIWVYDANIMKLIKVGKTAAPASGKYTIIKDIAGNPIGLLDTKTGAIIDISGQLGTSDPFSYVAQNSGNQDILSEFPSPFTSTSTQ
ncbi:MAG: LysM peptidoglycan-binding domain-containing protein, partial [Thermoprotei archaeon]